MIDRLLALSRVRDVPGLRQATGEAFRAAGFDAAYFVTPVNSHRGPHRLMANVGFPDAWEATYRARGYLADPFPDIAVALAQPFHWHDLPDTVILRDDERLYADSLREWDMETGIGIPTYGPFARTGFVGVGLPQSGSRASQRTLDLLRVIAETSFLRYCDLIREEFEEMPALSPRELEVLTRIAQGKSKSTIAGELDVSKDTVDTYFRRIYAKLDVSDRGAAVATGIARGALIASNPRISPAMRRRQPNEDGPAA